MAKQYRPRLLAIIPNPELLSKDLGEGDVEPEFRPRVNAGNPSRGVSRGRRRGTDFEK